MPPATASRIRDSLTTWSRRVDRPPAAGARGAAGAAGAAAGAGAAGAAGRRGCRRRRRVPAPGPRPPAIACSTSSRRIRPPVAGAGDRGDVQPGLRDQPAHQRREHPAVAVGGRGRGRRRRRRADAAAGAAAPPPPGRRRRSRRPPVAPGSPMRASTVPTGTVSPSPTRISSSTPSYGLGISESTLSVDTSNSGSSNSTVSPTCLSQDPIVPSVTVSPSLGIVMSCTTPAGTPTLGVLVRRALGAAHLRGWPGRRAPDRPRRPR